MDVGTTLRTARERRNLEIQELAARTKIPAAVLLAIEENAFEKVPRGIFARGFIRAYAREVGLDSEEIVEQFLTETGHAPVALAPESQPPDEDMVDEIRFDADASGSGPGWGYALTVAALLVAFVSFTRPTPSPEPGEAMNALPHEAVVDAPVQAVSAVLNDLQPVATTHTGLRLELQVTGPCWVEAIVDGRKLVYRLMEPGERETIDIGRELVLRVGDPAALTYSLNGRTGEPLGKPGVPITVRFTAEGERTELAS